MSAVITIPLEKNKELSALVADKQPGQKLYGCFSIKSKDDQSLILRIEEMTDNKEDLPDKAEYSEDDDSEMEDDSIEEEAGNGSSPDETENAIRFAAPGGYTGP
jgi:hypothetical protein